MDDLCIILCEISMRLFDSVLINRGEQLLYVKKTIGFCKRLLKILQQKVTFWSKISFVWFVILEQKVNFET